MNHSQSEANRTNHSHESLARTTHNPVWIASFPSAVPVSGSRQRFPVGVSRQSFPSAFPVSVSVATRSAEKSRNYLHKPLTIRNQSHEPLKRTTHNPKPLARTTHTNHSHEPLTFFVWVATRSVGKPRDPDGTRPRPDRLGDRVADPTTHKPLANH